MRRKHEVIDGHSISVWDDGNKVIDRYTVVFLDDEYDNGKMPYLAMSVYPFHPQGFCQHGEMATHLVAHRGRGGAFTKRISFFDLPSDCQKAVRREWE